MPHDKRDTGKISEKRGKGRPTDIMDGLRRGYRYISSKELIQRTSYRNLWSVKACDIMIVIDEANHPAEIYSGTNCVSSNNNYFQSNK